MMIINLVIKPGNLHNFDKVKSFSKFFKNSTAQYLIVIKALIIVHQNFQYIIFVENKHETRKLMNFFI